MPRRDIARCSTRSHPQMRARRGVALIFVLGLLIVLGVLGAEMTRVARLETGIVTSVRARTVGRYAAESGIVAAVARVDAMLDSITGPQERAAAFLQLPQRMAALNDASLGGARFGVAFADLNARIDLNKADPEALRNFFRQFTSAHAADMIVASLRARPLQRLGELALVPGVDANLALAVAPYVTVLSDGAVNINSAPEVVLAAQPGIGAAMARSIMSRRQAGEVLTGTTPQPTNGLPQVVMTPVASSSIVATMPSRLLIIARGWQEGSPLTHEIQAVYSVAGSRLSLIAWQERDL